MTGGPYYVILDVAIHDVATYLTYMDRVTPALEAAGGRYLSRGGALTTYVHVGTGNSGDGGILLPLLALFLGLLARRVAPLLRVRVACRR